MPVEKFDRFDEALEAIQEGARDGLEQAAEDELETIEEGFASGRDALGRRWAGLSPETVRSKGHDRILIDSGNLSESTFVKVTATGTVILGLSDSKAAIHEYGTRTIPRRPILGPALTDMKDGGLSKEIGDEIKNALRGKGFRLR